MTNEELLKEINKLKNEIETLSKKLDNKQGRVTARVSELEEKVKKYKNQIANLDAANDNKKERIAGLEKKLDTKQGRMVERVKALEGVVEDHAEDLSHEDLVVQSKVYLNSGTINRVNNTWRRLSFDGNYAMEMEDWTFTSTSGHRGLKPNVTGFYDVDVNVAIEPSDTNVDILSQSMRVYKVSAETDQILEVLGTTSNTSAIRGSVAPTLDLNIKNVYLTDKDFILVGFMVDDGGKNVFRHIDGRPDTTNLSLELRHAKVLEGLEIESPDVEIPNELCIDFGEENEFSGTYTIAKNTHQGIAYWKKGLTYIHYSGERDTWVITSPTEGDSHTILATMTPSNANGNWPWLGAWMQENENGEIIDLPNVTYGECIYETTPTPTTQIYSSTLAVAAPKGYVALILDMSLDMMLESFPVGSRVIISPDTEIEEVGIVARFFPLILETPLLNDHPKGAIVKTSIPSPTPTPTPTPTNEPLDVAFNVRSTSGKIILTLLGEWAGACKVHYVYTSGGNNTHYGHVARDGQQNGTPRIEYKKSERTLYIVMPYNGTHWSYGWTSLDDFEKLVSFYPNATTRRTGNLYGTDGILGNLKGDNIKYTGRPCETPTPTPTTGNFYERTPTPTTGNFYERTPTPTTGNFYERTPTPTTGNFYERTPTPSAKYDEVKLQQVQKVQESWKKLGITEYKFNFKWECYCTEAYTSLVEVHVAENEIKSVKYVDPSDEMNYQVDLEKYHTIDELFEYIMESIKSMPYSLEVEYDDKLTMPTKFNVNPKLEIADDETGFSITKFVGIK